MENYYPNAIYLNEFSSGTFVDTPNTEWYQFECLNPLKITTFAEEMGIENPTEEQSLKRLKSRKDANVSSMRNFVFECDGPSMKEQAERASFLKNKKIINRIVFSGNKSLHCRITINREPESIIHYKWLWHVLNEKFFAGKADCACANPARLTRKPNGIRVKNGKKILQKLVYEDDNVIFDISIFDQAWELNKLESKLSEQYREKHDTRRVPNNVNIIDELASLSEAAQEGDKWQVAWALAQNDGTLSYQNAAKAVSYLGFLGFSADDILQQIEFKKWNFRKDYIERLIERYQ